MDKRDLSNIGKEYVLAAFLFLIVSFILYKSIVLSNGIVYYLDVNFALDPSSLHFSEYTRQFMWDQIHGRAAAPITWWFNDIVSDIGLVLGGSMEASSKIVYLGVPALCGFLAYVSLRWHFNNKIGCAVAGLLIITSPWFVSHYIYGHMWVMLSVGLLFPAVSATIRLYKKLEWRWILIASYSITLSAIFDQRNIYVYAIIIVLYIVSTIIVSIYYKKGVKATLMHAIKVHVPRTAIIAVMFAGLSAFWILTLNQVLSGMNPYYPSNETLSILSVNIVGSIMPYYPGWYEQILGPWFIVWFSILTILYLAIYVYIFSTRGRVLMILGLILVVGVFLSKGVSEPFGSIYSWMFENIPFFSAFRNPTHLIPIVLIALAVAVMLLFNKDRELSKKFRFRWKKSERFVPIAVLCVIALLVVQAAPIATANLEQVKYLPTWSPQTLEIPASYMDMIQYLNNAPGDYKFIAFPPLQGTTYPWSNSTLYDPLMYFVQKPMLSVWYASEDTRINDMGWWLYQMIYNNRTDNIGPILGYMGVKWVVLTDATPEQWVIESLGNPSTNITDYFANQTGFKEVFHEGPYEILENAYAQPFAQLANDSGLIVGDRRMLITNDGTGTGASMLNESTFFLAGLQGLNQSLLWNNTDTMYIQGDQFNDLVFNELQSSVLHPTDYLQRTEDIDNDWIYDAYDVVRASTGVNAFVEPYAHTNGFALSRLSVPFDVTNGGEKEIWAKVLVSNGFGTLLVNIDGVDERSINIGNSSGMYPVGMLGFEWIKISDLDLAAGSHTITFSSIGQNAIANAAVLDEGQYNQTLDAVTDEVSQKGMKIVQTVEGEQMYANQTDLLVDKVGDASGGQMSQLNSTILTTAQMYSVGGGDWSLNIRYRSNSSGNLSLTINGKSVGEFAYQNNSQMVTQSLGNLTLLRGENTIQVNVTSDLDLDIIDLEKNATTTSNITGSSPIWSIQDPTKVTVTVGDTNGSLLVVRTPYDPEWVLTSASGEQIKPMIFFGCYLAYDLGSKYSNQTLTLTYLPQKTLETGREISVITFIITIVVTLILAAWWGWKVFKKKRHVSTPDETKQQGGGQG